MTHTTFVNWQKQGKVKRVCKMFFHGKQIWQFIFRVLGNAWVGCMWDSSNRCTELMQCARKQDLFKHCVISFANLIKTTKYQVFFLIEIPNIIYSIINSVSFSILHLTRSFPICTLSYSFRCNICLRRCLILHKEDAKASFKIQV